jgi:4-amino-4-deoxy-L-arabinose transferase-like glycosyltransferase
MDANRTLRQWLIFLAVILVGRTLLSSILPLTDFSEARYAEIGRKILVFNDWITLWFMEDVPFWGKPPLAFWSVAASFKVLGVSFFNDTATTEIYTLVTAAVVFRWVRIHWNQEVAVYVAVVFLGAWLTLQTAGAVITDPLLVLSTTVVMTCFWDAIHVRDRFSIWVMWIALGIGLLAKGPLAPVLCGLACGAWVIVYRQWKPFFSSVGGIMLIPGLIVMLLVAAPWYLAAERATPGFFDYFIVGEHFQRYVETEWPGDRYGGVKDQPLGMIWIYFLLASMPWSLFAVVRLLKRSNRIVVTQSYHDAPLLTGYLLCWTLAPLVFFTPAKNILITYVMPALPAAAVLIATRADAIIVPRRYLIHTASIAAIIFFLGFLGAWYVGGYENHRYNQRPIIRAYQAMNEVDPGPLIYTGAYRFSAVFYTRDNVKFSARPQSYYIDETFYVAVRDMWKGNPAKGRCEERFRHNEFTLWHCPARQ